MAGYFPFMLTLNLFLSSAIFIIGAYLLERLSEINNWQSDFLNSAKNTLTILSIISMFTSVLMYLVLKPF